MKHMDRVESWKDGNVIYPVNVAINLTDKCNQRCPKCSTIDKNDIFIPTALAKSIIRQLSELDIKSTSFGGGGDPTCHPDFAEMIRYAAKYNLEIGMATNGYVLTDDMIDAITEHCTWGRISMDAGDPETYYKVHAMKKKGFDKMIGNIAKLVKVRNDKKSKMVFGVTFLIGEHTIDGAYKAVKMARSLGVDYIRLRHFFDWSNTQYTNEQRQHHENILAQCKSLETDIFSVSYPADRVEAIFGERKRLHKKCYIHHFSSIITADCKVYPCCLLADNLKYAFGDLSKNTFKDVWNSEQRKKAYQTIDFKDCPNPCMLEKHNEVLWAEKHGEYADGISVEEMELAKTQHIEHENFL